MHDRPDNGKARSLRREGVNLIGALPDIAVVRSNSRLERTNRELRRTFRQVGCFSSPKGTEVAVYIQVTRLNAQWSKTSWWEASHSLALDLLNSNP